MDATLRVPYVDPKNQKKSTTFITTHFKIKVAAIHFFPMYFLFTHPITMVFIFVIFVTMVIKADCVWFGKVL